MEEADAVWANSCGNKDNTRALCHYPRYAHVHAVLFFILVIWRVADSCLPVWEEDVCYLATALVNGGAAGGGFAAVSLNQCFPGVVLYSCSCICAGHMDMCMFRAGTEQSYTYTVRDMVRANVACSTVL